MIIIKVILIIILCYFFSKGMQSKYMEEIESLHEKLKDHEDLAKETFQKLQAEKVILTDTIKKLRGLQ